jgi:trans-aconitate 2-methyltransferase
VSTTWEPALYLDFDDQRSRPFHDLVARIGATAPRRVVDLGCGPGHLTSLLAARWPDAQITASDSSAEMVAAARSRGIDAERADVVDWRPGPEDDVVVTNAVLQWVPTNVDLLPGWIAASCSTSRRGAGW